MMSQKLNLVLGGCLTCILLSSVLAAQAANQRTRPYVEALAADVLEGRLTGTTGAHQAADYIIEQLRSIGAELLPGQQDYRLPFEFTAGVSDGGSSLVITNGAPWQTAEVVQGLSFSDSAVVQGEVVFAGYGLVVPEAQEFSYDSYATLNVEGKIVLILRYFPEDVEQAYRGILARYSGLRYKAMAARQRGATAVVVITGPRSPNAGQTVPMTFDTAIAGSGIVAASVNGAVADAIFAHVPNQTLDSIQAELDTGNPHIAGFAIDGLELTLDVTVTRETLTGNNVVGYLPPSSSSRVAPEAKPYVMYGAHYDHLGYGMQGNSLARQNEHGAIHNGADDNASGVAAVLAAGASLAELELDRGIILAFWSGEELGLLGSSEFVKNAPVPIEQISAYLNFDMVGRARNNRLSLQAVGTSRAWRGLIEQSNVPVGFNVALQDDPYLPTDVMSLNAASVPSLNFFTGNHEDYHRPTDDAEAINYDDLDRVARLGALIGRNVALRVAPLEFVQVEQVAQQGQRASVRVFTGTIPDYTSDIEGLLLGGVIEGGPAALAGLQQGDVIVEFAGQSITNIYDYTYALDAVKVGEELTVVFIRDGERLQVTLTPTAR